jgi:hypothetical protein
MTLEISSEAEDGLLGLVSRAERAVLESTVDPVGVLTIELVEPRDSNFHLAVEASFVERAGLGVVERLEVHSARSLEGDPDRELLRALLAASGGTAFTSVCLRDTDHELVDATLHFGSALKLMGRVTALSADTLAPEQAEACAHALAALGLGCRVAGTLHVSGRRLGTPPSVGDQVETLLRARAKGLQVELFVSTLPVTRSVRLAIGREASSSSGGYRGASGAGQTSIVCTLSRQIPKSATSIARDAVELRQAVEQHLGFGFPAARWRVDNAHGERDEHRAHGPLGGGRRLEWSLNWGAKRG